MVEARVWIMVTYNVGLSLNFQNSVLYQLYPDLQFFLQNKPANLQKTAWYMVGAPDVMRQSLGKYACNSQGSGYGWIRVF